MVLRDEFETIGTTKIVSPNKYLPTTQNKYDSLFGFNRETNTISPTSALITSANKYDSLFGFNRTPIVPSVSKTPTVSETSGTVGEVAKAWTGSFGAGVLNLISSAVGTMERQLVAGTDAEGIGITGMWDNIVKAFSPQSTSQERAKVAADLFRSVTNILHPEQIRTSKEVNTVKDVLNKEGGSFLESEVKKGETAVRKWADVENESGVTKFFSGISEAFPASLATRIPVIGWFLLGNNVYKNTIEQTRADYAAKGQAMPEGLATFKALGYTAMEIIIEMASPTFGRFAKSGAAKSFANGTRGWLSTILNKITGKTGEEVVDMSLKGIIKGVRKAFVAEGLEEVATDFGDAIIAKLTTNKDDPFMDFRDPDGSLISFKSLGLSFLSGAIMGGVTAGAGAVVSKIKGNNQFNRTKESLEDIQDKKIKDITDEDVYKVVDNLNIDVEKNDNGEQEVVADNLTNFVGKVAENQGQTFETDTGKLFTIPANQTVDASKVSPDAFRDVIAMQDNRKTTTTPTTVPEAPATAQTAQGSKLQYSKWVDTVSQKPLIQKGLTYDQYQKAIDDYSDELMVKYGEDEVLHAPISYMPRETIESNRISPFTNTRTPLTDAELAKLEALYDARDNVDKDEGSKDIVAIVDKLNFIKDSWVPTKEDVSKYLHEMRDSVNYWETLIKREYKDKTEFGQEIYNGIIQSTEFPWDVVSYEDAVRELVMQLNGQFGQLGKNIVPLFDAVNQIYQAITGDSNIIYPIT
ncbi:MAG: hypothetical protein WC325_12275, partial [Candidatus Bathyarchaeia archaeon]